MDRVKRIWYLSPMRAAKVQASLRIRAVSPEPSLLAHTSSESRGTLRQKARSLAQLNGWACAIEICHDGMLEDTNSLDGAHMSLVKRKPVPGFSTREDSNRPAQLTGLVGLEILAITSRGIILSRQRTTKALIRLHGCACWSAPLLFAYGINGFSHDVAHMIL